MDDFSISTDDTSTMLSSLAASAAASGSEQFAQLRDLHRARLRALSESRVEAGTTVADVFKDLAARESDRIVRPLERPPVREVPSLPILEGELRSTGLSLRGAPYDFEWTDRLNSAWLVADRANGEMEIELHSGSVNNAEHAWGGAGVGISHTTKQTTGLMRVSQYLTYSYRWDNASTLEVARNRGTVSVLVREVSGKLALDGRTALWHDSTAWYETHSDDVSDVFTDSAYVFVKPDTQYELWFWFDASIDFNHFSGDFLDFGSSRANSILLGQLRWIVLEEYGS